VTERNRRNRRYRLRDVQIYMTISLHIYRKKTSTCTHVFYIGILSRSRDRSMGRAMGNSGVVLEVAGSNPAEQTNKHKHRTHIHH